MTAPGQGVLAISADARRKAHAEELLRSALGGSLAALGQLFFEAYEKRTGAAGDMRTPRDGKYSPQDVRDLAVRALRQYAISKGGIPEDFARYAVRLGTVVIPSRRLDEAVKAVPSAPSIPPTRADDERSRRAADAITPVVIEVPGASVPVFVPSSASVVDGPTSGDVDGVAVDGRAAVGGSDSSSAASSKMWLAVGAVAGIVLLLSRRGRR